MPKIMGWVIDSQREEMDAFFAGDGVLVTDISCPEVDAVFREVCETLGLERASIRFFIKPDPNENAFTTGSGIPTVVATNALVNSLPHICEIAFHCVLVYPCVDCRTGT